MPQLGGGEILIIALIIFILFGAKAIPNFAKGMGEAIREWKKAIRDTNDTGDRNQ